jgi:hypothetical protein
MTAVRNSLNFPYFIVLYQNHKNKVNPTAEIKLLPLRLISGSTEKKTNSG